MSPSAAVSARKMILNREEATNLRSESQVAVGNALIKLPSMPGHFKTSSAEFDKKEVKLSRRVLKQVALKKKFMGQRLMPAERRPK